MNSPFATAMGRALRQTRAGNPLEATRTIQAVLAGRHAREATRPREDVDDAEVLEEHPKRTRSEPREPKPPRRRLSAVVDALNRGRREFRWVNLPGTSSKAVPKIPEGARYERRRFACAAGARDYRLYVPAALPDGPQGLVLMLHGCTQNPDDFACGTQMNQLAEAHGLILAYPEQCRGQNAKACWNWFRPGDQARAGGEPEILAGLATGLAEEFGIDRARVFVAGLSAGGAMAAILGATHPEIFRAVGIHSGLPHGSARDVVSAFAAMRGEGSGRQKSPPAVPTIVFHGTADPTVHPSNATDILAATADELRRDQGISPGGRRYSRLVTGGGDAAPENELWLIEGAGHAWSGGAAEGSYTDPLGPDASAEMVRFFLAGTAAVDA